MLCDEIQSSAWYDTLFLFRKYGLQPDFVSIGKGFPGGLYPASCLLVSGAFDCLSQFGARSSVDRKSWPETLRISSR